ncbi:hypothetical protein [Xenorhabdus thailandensis]|uniref:hypothetical protein n=1 Tax=Xenorhabdus thailandensis TaxID=3136255 RepID=UPI0030F3BF01
MWPGHASAGSLTSGRDDVVIGSVLSGRLQGVQGLPEILGMFINTLPLRSLDRYTCTRHCAGTYHNLTTCWNMNKLH